MIRTSKRTTLDQDATRGGFPQRKAFVLQFSDDAGPRTGLFRGQVEHLTTGDRTVFHSTEQLWSFVRAVLGEGVGAVPALPPAQSVK
ncbi:MAG: hypothetical protein ABR587_10980 [Candidatus Binatia bacterium]